MLNPQALQLRVGVDVGSPVGLRGREDRRVIAVLLDEQVGGAAQRHPPRRYSCTMSRIIEAFASSSSVPRINHSHSIGLR